MEDQIGIKPWLWLPARAAHDLSPLALAMLAAVRRPSPLEWRPFEWRGLRFPNPLGIAGGVDKSGASARGWWALGAGFLEIGTVVPRPQGPNPGKIMSRDVPARALWNKMGFPSDGCERARRTLERLPRPRPTPVFVNVGKNRDVPNERAAGDYAACVRELYGVADAFVINVSSPNTKSLRELQRADSLDMFLAEIVAARDEAQSRAGGAATPLLIKLSPDLDSAELRAAVEVALDRGLDGFVAANTTSARTPNSTFPADGGLSGAPLAERSIACLRHLLAALGARRTGKLVVSVGGVMSGADALQRLEIGADLVQAYSALVFEGPWFFKRAIRDAQIAFESRV